MGHILNRERLRVVERNERGAVTYRKRYKKGDEVDTSHIDDARVQNFLDTGVLVESEDDLSEPESATATSPTGGPFGAATTHSDATGVPEDDQVEEGTDDSGEFDDEADDPNADLADDEHDVDEYDSMDYAELQQAAKAKGVSASGSAVDLRNRLRNA